MAQPQDLFSKFMPLMVEFNLNTKEKLRLREISNVNLSSIIMGDVTILQKLIPHISNANLMKDKGI